MFNGPSRGIVKLILGCAIAATVSSCACSDTRKPHTGKKGNEVAEAAIPTSMMIKANEAVAYINPTKGNQVQGKISFTKVPGGIKVVADLEGLTPGKHGIHVHEHGDCSGDEASAAGAHFNPTQAVHAGPDDSIRHVGDLGNIIADASGRAHYERVDSVITLEGVNSILGRSVIVHADQDDFHTQPAGASGAKIACGVIEAVSSR